MIREGSRADIPAFCKLEEECFADPWTQKGFEDSFSGSCFRCLAAEKDGVVCGYVGMLLIDGEAEITNVAVSRNHRREGIGAALIRALLAMDGVTRVLLDVRESNLAARGLYEKMGFAVDGVRKNFYRKPTENAILMSREVDRGNLLQKEDE